MITFNFNEEFPGSVSDFTIELDETNLTHIAYHFRKFLVAAGYTYVTEVVIHKEHGGQVSSNDNL